MPSGSYFRVDILFTVEQSAPAGAEKGKSHVSPRHIEFFTVTIQARTTLFAGVIAPVFSSLFLMFSPRAAAQPATAIEIGNGTVDSERILGQRWVRVAFDPLNSGTHTISVSWDNNAVVRFSLFQVVNDDSIRIAKTGPTNSPLEWTGTLSGSGQYHLGIWAVSGSTNFTAFLEEVTDSPGNDRLRGRRRATLEAY